MAKLRSQVQFTGTLDNLSAYTMRGVEGIVIRKKGGPSKKQIKKSPNFERTRHNNAEFGARSSMGRMIRSVLHPLPMIADYNASGPLSSLLKPVQMRHIQTVMYEKRSVRLSEVPDAVNGFSFNRKHPLESFLSAPVDMQLTRETMLITVSLPEIIPGINFKNFGNYPSYRFIITAGFVSDLAWDNHQYEKLNRVDTDSKTKLTEWAPCRSTTPSQKLTLSLKKPSGKHLTCIGGIGIQFGVLTEHGIEETRFGAGKIVMSC